MTLSTGIEMTSHHWRLAIWMAAPTLVLLVACHDARRENPLDPALTPPVELQVALDDTAGTATLTWSAYAGDQPFAFQP
jgi:hypothetical protein